MGVAGAVRQHEDVGTLALQPVVNAQFVTGMRDYERGRSREQGERFVREQLGPILERMAGEAAERGDDTFTPPARESWYELHDSMTG